MEKNYNKNLFLTLFFIFLVIATNDYFNYDNSLIYGGSDGKFYISISKYSPNLGNNIEYIKGEDFLPYFIGIISKLSSVDLFFLYQITSIFLIITLILLYRKILILLKIENYSYIFFFYLWYLIPI